MANWREDIVKKFNPANSMYVVLDSDGLLLDETIIEMLEEKNIHIVPFQDNIMFRFEFETVYRQKVLRKDLCLLVRFEEKATDKIPYDLLQIGQQVKIDVAKIFPMFSSLIVKQLDVEVLEALYTAREQYQGSSSNRETLNFITKRIYKLAYDIVDTKVELWSLLLTIHYGSLPIPKVVKEFIAEILSDKIEIRMLPIKELISSSATFYSYMDEEWKQFIQSINEVLLEHPEIVLEEYGYYSTHPFASNSIIAIIDNLFSEGLLNKVECVNATKLPTWMHMGIKKERGRNQAEKLEQLRMELADIMDSARSYKDWTKLADLIGQYQYLTSSQLDNTNIEIKELHKKINKSFEQWILQNYGSMISLPHIPMPKMVHHIPHFLASKSDEKVALLVMDGMSFTQWSQIKDTLGGVGFKFEVNGVFAWVPTLTSISRQALFSGKLPTYFANSISTTNKESAFWSVFWENQGLSKLNIAYQRGLGKESYSKGNIDAFKRSNVKVYGAVIDIVDKALHGAVQGMKSVEAELRIWLESGYLQNIISDLVNQGFVVYLTADHGNKESVGIGRISEGVLVDSKGERVRIYNQQVLRDYTANQHPNTIKWTDLGLPENFHVLVAKADHAFVNRGETIVSHGGISLDEVIVPFVKVIS